MVEITGIYKERDPLHISTIAIGALKRKPAHCREADAGDFHYLYTPVTVSGQGLICAEKYFICGLFKWMWG